ncbi:hypothetical protein CDL15_Pgr003541 [Punica granatum]|uniref:FBD domain-containing protein n=1 Tax=Punica granatum TaxID=22663 RepID=A0A218X3I6_PUNGR|nr:hypothetical protein CDL15_Pgr003541 [Punica granatum]
MDHLHGEILQHIISYICNARNIDHVMQVHLENIERRFRGGLPELEHLSMPWCSWCHRKLSKALGSASQDDQSDGEMDSFDLIDRRTMSPLIDLPHPEQCSIELTTFASCAFSLTSPKIKSLKLEAFGWIKVSNTGSLRSLSITNPKGVRELDRRGGLPAHEYLSTSVCPWCWRKMSKVLRSANKVEHLKMAGSNFIGPSRPTLQVDIVDFFRNHPKLERLEINDHKLAVLSAKNTPHDAVSTRHSRPKLLFQQQNVGFFFLRFQNASVVLSRFRLLLRSAKPSNSIAWKTHFQVQTHSLNGLKVQGRFPGPSMFESSKRASYEVLPAFSI